MQNHASSPPSKPTVHVRSEGDRYRLTISGPNRAYAVQRLREALPGHRRCYRQSDNSWSMTHHRALVAWLTTDRGVVVDWPEAEAESA